MTKQSGIKIIAKNKTAPRDYEILEKYEAGIVLLGPEVKSLREHPNVSFKDSFVKIKDGEAWLLNLYIPPYRHNTLMKIDPLRTRKLLLHKREIKRLAGKVEQKGLTIIPLSLYFKNGKVKVEIAVAKGKKKADVRRELREKALKRELERKFKGKLKL
jgi:SsrA-binding protein